MAIASGSHSACGRKRALSLPGRCKGVAENHQQERIHYKGMSFSFRLPRRRFNRNLLKITNVCCIERVGSRGSIIKLAILLPPVCQRDDWPPLHKALFVKKSANEMGRGKWS